MINFFRLFLILFLTSVTPAFVSAQSAKEWYKKGKEAVKEKKYTEAIENFTRAINLNTQYKDALKERGNCYLLLNFNDKANIDFVALQKMEPKNTTYIFLTGITYMNLERWMDAQHMFLLFESDEINQHIGDVQEKLIYCALKLKEFESALTRAGTGITDFPNNEIYYYYRGVAYDSLKDYQAAVLSYDKAITMVINRNKKEAKLNPTSANELIQYHVRLADAQMHLFDFDKAVNNYTSAIDINKKNDTIYYKRGLARFAKLSFNEALIDFNTAYQLGGRYPLLMMARAGTYKKLGLFNNAIEDLGVFEKSDTAYYAALLKAQCYESIGKYLEAKESYEKANKMTAIKNRKEAENGVTRNKSKLYEIQREGDVPVIKIITPEVIDTKLMVTKSQTFIEITGKIMDKSPIKSINVNGVEADYNKDSLNPSFKVKASIIERDKVVLTVSDIYSNKAEEWYLLNRTERNKPTVRLFISMSKNSNQIYFNNKKESILHITGKVEDESLIKSLLINNVSVAYHLNQIEPGFEADIDVSRTDSVIIKLTDEFDNSNVLRYYINSKEAQQIATNPMGKTWMVFIENSNYEFFSSLDGPQKDLELVRNTFLQYRFDNILVKKNMTLTDMEKFFRIELRDEVKQNEVNSIVIWYAGHGRFLNETGYWIPINAKKDDEFSYYPIPYLKGNLSGYGKSLQHILIVSDACESGPAFAVIDEKFVPVKCDNSEALKNLSAQVFSSTTNEKASDNSLFCESFTNALKNNNQSCISINDVVNDVTGIVQKNQKQRCKFGRIQGFDNNSGSFLFLKR